MHNTQTITFPHSRSEINFNPPSNFNQLPNNEELKKYWQKELRNLDKTLVVNSNHKKIDGEEDFLSLVNRSSNRGLQDGEANYESEDLSIKQSLKEEETNDQIEALIRKSNRIIISISTGFPWTIFRNSMIVEESRVIFIFRQFLSSQSHTVDIKDISNVFIESSLFYSTLQIVSKTFIQNDIKIGNLNRKKANKVRRIIESLRSFAGSNIDTSNYEIQELVDKLEQLHTIK